MRDNHRLTVHVQSSSAAAYTSPMNVHCPHCLTGYEIPEHLIGAGGSRVHCPGCEQEFVVPPPEQAGGAEGTIAQEVIAEAIPGTASEAGVANAATSAEEPVQVAVAVLDVLADFLGEALECSRARGTVLSDHGPAIIAVWDEYRRRAGANAPSPIFRAALRDRCGVDLSRANGS
ncbi:MAG: zinc-ribbon domain-containing protein [Candidatus Eiseniibacteriota bacterium]